SRARHSSLPTTRELGNSSPACVSLLFRQSRIATGIFRRLLARCCFLLPVEQLQPPPPATRRSWCLIPTALRSSRDKIRSFAARTNGPMQATLFPWLISMPPRSCCSVAFLFRRHPVQQTISLALPRKPLTQISSTSALITT